MGRGAGHRQRPHGRDDLRRRREGTAAAQRDHRLVRAAGTRAEPGGRLQEPAGHPATDPGWQIRGSRQGDERAAYLLQRRPGRGRDLRLLPDARRPQLRVRSAGRHTHRVPPLAGYRRRRRRCQFQGGRRHVDSRDLLLGDRPGDRHAHRLLAPGRGGVRGEALPRAVRRDQADRPRHVDHDRLQHGTAGRPEIRSPSARADKRRLGFHRRRQVHREGRRRSYHPDRRQELQGARSPRGGHQAIERRGRAHGRRHESGSRQGLPALLQSRVAEPGQDPQRVAPHRSAATALLRGRGRSRAGFALLPVRALPADLLKPAGKPGALQLPGYLGRWPAPALGLRLQIEHQFRDELLARRNRQPQRVPHAHAAPDRRTGRARPQDRPVLLRRSRLGDGLHHQSLGMDRSRRQRALWAVLLRRSVGLPAPVGAL